MTLTSSKRLSMPLSMPLSSLALAALLMCSAPAQAASFSFGGSTDSGPLSGANFSGLFSYSDSGLPADGEVQLSSFSLSFAGQSYTLASATTTPSAVFAGGSFIGLSYVDDASADTALRPQVSFTPGFFSLPDAYLAYVGSSGQGGFGSYTVTAVPEPQSLALMLAGCGLVAAAARSRMLHGERQGAV